MTEQQREMLRRRLCATWFPPASDAGDGETAGSGEAADCDVDEDVRRAS